MIHQRWKQLCEAPNNKMLSQSNLPFTCREVTAALYGFNTLDDTKMSRKLLSFLINQQDVVKRVSELTTRQVVLCLYGMKSFSCKWFVVKQTLSILTRSLSMSISDQQGVLTSSDIGILLSCLENFSSTTPEVQNLLSILSTTSTTSGTRRTDQDVIKKRDCILGIKNMSLMSNQQGVVVDLLRGLYQQLKSSYQSDQDKSPLLTPSEIAQCMKGLQSMSIDHQQQQDDQEQHHALNNNNNNKVIQDLLDQFTNDLVYANNVDNKVHMLQEVEVSNCLYSLQKKSYQDQHVVDFLKALSDHVTILSTRSGGKSIIWRPKQLSMALYGLQDVVVYDKDEVNKMLSFVRSRFPLLVDKIKWNLNDISYCLYGIRFMKSSHIDFVRDVYSMILPPLEEYQVRQKQQLDQKEGQEQDVVEVIQCFCYCLNGLQEVIKTFGYNNNNIWNITNVVECFNKKLIQLSVLINKGHSDVINNQEHVDRITSWYVNNDKQQEVEWDEDKLRAFLNVSKKVNKKTTRSDKVSSNPLMKKIINQFNTIRKESINYDMNSTTTSQQDDVMSLVVEVNEMLSHDETSSLNWTWKNISKCLFSLQNIDSDMDIVRSLLQKFHNIVSQQDVIVVDDDVSDVVVKKDVCSIEVLSHCFFGLRHMDSNHMEVKNILKLLIDKLDQQVDHLNVDKDVDQQQVDERHLGMCLSGLMTIHHHNTEVDDEFSNKMLQVFTKLIDRLLTSKKSTTRHNISCHTAASSCYYMQNLSYHHEGVDDFLLSLNDLLVDTRSGGNKLKNQEIAMTLLGLKNKFSLDESRILQQILENIHSLMLYSENDNNDQSTTRRSVSSCCWVPLDGVTVALGIYGLSGVNLDHHSDIIHRIMKWFAINLNISRVHVGDNRGPSTALTTTSCCDDNEDVNQSTFSFSPTSSLQLRPHEVALTSYGLKQLSADEQEVRTILSYLTNCIHNNMNKSLQHQYYLNQQLVVIEISMLLYGLKRMNSNIKEVREFVEAISVWCDFLLSQHNEICQSLKDKNMGDISFNAAPDDWMTRETLSAYKDLHQDDNNNNKKKTYYQSLSLLDNQALCMCISGMKYLNSDHKEVKKLLRTVTDIVKQTKKSHIESQYLHYTPLNLWEFAKIMGGNN